MSLEQNLTTEGLRARYDDAAKHLLANKQILARILKTCVKEFRDDPLTDIIHAISDDVKISTVPLNPGMTNQVIPLSQESSVSNEGTIYFDLLFNAVARHPVTVRVWINIEPQNDYYPGSARIPRGVFYGARELSAQAETTFSLAKQEYDKLQKVYSIWIFMNPPEKDSDTITSYRMCQKNLHGNFTGQERYDLLEVISICLCQDPDDSTNDLIRILSTLFTRKLTVKEKIAKLKNYGIMVNDEYGKELGNMCNLSEGVYNEGVKHGVTLGMKKGVKTGERRGVKKGVKKGERKNSIEAARNFVNITNLSDKQISDAFSGVITPEEVGKLRKGEKLI